MKKKDILKMTDAELDAKVKIQGTKYDRKCKLSESTLKKIKKLAKNNTYYQIAKKLGLVPNTVRYHIDTEFKAHYNATRDGRHFNTDKITVKNCIEYKRSLVAAGKIGI